MSALPPDAIDAAVNAYTATLLLPLPDERERESMRIALVAAWPHLRTQWERDELVEVREALREELAEVGRLQGQLNRIIDETRAIHRASLRDQERDGIGEWVCDYDGEPWPCATTSALEVSL